MIISRGKGLMRKKTVFFFLFILILFLFFTPGNFALAKKCTTNKDCEPAKCVEGKCVRALELVYPSISGEKTPETIAAGLPEYVNYIFQLAIWIIGLVIFGVLVYNGVIYLTSVGNPTKFTEAKSGIFAGVLGGVILLSAYLIFNTINPQLTILEIEKLPPLRPIVFPGIYICNYGKEKIGDINKILGNYLSSDTEKRAEAVKNLKEMMDLKDGKTCFKVNYSGNFQNLTVEKDKNIFFIIPAEYPEYDPQTKKTKYKYVSEYGLVLHEKDNFGGKCQLLFEGSKIYQKEDQEHYVPTSGTFSQLYFESRSFTLFKKPEPEPSAEAGVSLYSCPGYGYPDKPETCSKDIVSIATASFPVGNADMRKVAKNELETLLLAENVRSIKIDPKGSFLALIFDNEGKDEEKYNFKGKCEVISSNVVDLTQHPIGRCGSCFTSFWSYLNPGNLFKGKCVPCIKSMIVVKGQSL